MKKILITVLTIFLFCSNISAKEKTTFSIANTSANINDQVTIKLNIKDNPGFGVLTLKIKYDPNVVEYISSNINGLSKAMLKGCEDNQKGIITMYAIQVDTKNLIKDNGDILDVTFKVKDTKVSESNIQIEVIDFGIDDQTSLPYQVTNGKITINDNAKNKDSYQSKTTIKKDNESSWKKAEEVFKDVDPSQVPETSIKDQATNDSTDENDESTTKSSSINVPEEDQQAPEKKVNSVDKDDKTNYHVIIPSIIIIILITIIAIIIVIKRKKSNPIKAKKEKER